MTRNTTRQSPRQSTATDESGKSIAQFIEAIRTLPEDMPHGNPRVWYRTQKEHWLGWLEGYDGPGAYGRTQANRDAKFAYNHIVEPKMLLWLVDAAGVPGDVNAGDTRAATELRRQERLNRQGAALAHGEASAQDVPGGGAGRGGGL